MDRSHLDHLTTANTERVLLALTMQQHLHPTRSVAHTVRIICEDQGYSDLVADQALHELSIDGHTRIGRLSRQQIRRLAVRVESAWQSALADRIRIHEPQPT